MRIGSEFLFYGTVCILLCSRQYCSILSLKRKRNTYLGLLTFAGLIIAMIIQPLSGAFSDRLASRWGRRRPLIVFGTLFDLVFLVLLAWAGGLPMLVIGISVCSSVPISRMALCRVCYPIVCHASNWNGHGFKNLMDMGGLGGASLLAGRLLDSQARYPVTILRG